MAKKNYSKLARHIFEHLLTVVRAIAALCAAALLHHPEKGLEHSLCSLPLLWHTTAAAAVAPAPAAPPVELGGLAVCGVCLRVPCNTDFQKTIPRLQHSNLLLKSNDDDE